MDIEEKIIKYKEFNQAFGIPCVVHATGEKFMRSILKFKELRTHKSRDVKKLDDGRMHTAFIDSYVDLHDAIFLSVGFCYNLEVDKFPYGFIFSVDRVDKFFEVFKIHIILHLAKNCVRFWLKNEPEVFEKVSKKAKDMLEELQETDKTIIYAGVPHGYFAFWTISKEFETWFQKTEHTDELLKMFWVEREKLKIKQGIWNRSVKAYIKEMFVKSEIRSGEMVSQKNISLDDKRLIGFFVADDKIKPELRKFVESCKNLKKDKMVVFNGKKKTPLVDWLYN